ncbi:MAG: hypothetical protein K0U68_12205 [Gammaproteobacteria bacterium]|nr:hypothetical protein [Gammaproteobacteria bacterium]
MFKQCLKLGIFASLLLTFGIAESQAGVRFDSYQGYNYGNYYRPYSSRLSYGFRSGYSGNIDYGYRRGFRDGRSFQRNRRFRRRGGYYNGRYCPTRRRY